MRTALAALVVACSSPPPPRVHNEAPAGRASLWCGWLDAQATCFADRDKCTTSCTGCTEIADPHWTCSRVVRRVDHSLHFNTCYPSPELCAKDEVYSSDERESCTPAASVYCRDFEDSIVCHPTRAICEREAAGFAAGIRPLSPCTRRG